jgi:cytokinin dehydrogenase
LEQSNQSPLSFRAGIIAGIAPENLVVGFRRGENRWVTAAEGLPGDGTQASSNGSIAPLPYLDGVLLTGDAVSRSTGADYGGVVQRAASALLRPGSAEDVAGMVRFCARHKLPVAVRGQSHTLFGQSQVEDGVQIDMRLLDRVLEVRDGRVEVEAGAEWRSVLQATLTHGLTPAVLTDYLRLTVGGTLSVGGVSGTSWRYGAQVDSVEELTVVTGAGETLRCSESENRDLFEAVLAGQGQCGVIIKARLRLVSAPDSVRIFDLVYPGLPAAIADLRRLLDEERFEYVVILIVPGPQGWITVLQGVKWFARSDPPDNRALLAGLQLVPNGATVTEQTYFQFSDRVLAQIGDLRGAGLADYPHPWVDVFVPGSKVESFVGSVMAELTPADLGRSFPILLYPFRSGPLRRPLFRMPEEPESYLFDILRAATPGATGLEEMVRHNRKIFEQNRELGGTHYPISAFEVSATDWEAHYGPAWTAFAEAKRRYDPSGVLTPGPGIFSK